MKKEIKTYDPTALRRIQRIETEMLKEFAAVCEENSLQWFIGYGSAIGVVRHQGFIPWDDDIDIFMFRKDYEKFSEIVSKGEYNKRYELISAAVSDEYLMPEAHWQLRGTKFIDAPSLDLKTELGIFLDLFPLDNLADDPKERKKQLNNCFIWEKLMIVRCIPHPIVPYKGALGKIVSAILFIAHYVLKLLHVSPRWMFKQYKKHATKYNGQKTEYVTAFRGMTMDESKMTIDDIFPLRKMPYEDTEVYVNNHVEKSLTNLFGDYMKLPPEEKRHNHRPEILDFGTALKDFGIE